MAEIPGATVVFTDYSAPGTPRVLNIPDGHGDASVQDLWDTLSAEEAKLDNLVYKKLVERPGFGGKGVLSPTKSIGISLKANNIQAKFEDLPGPTYTIKRVVDGNFIAQDHLGNDMEPLASSTFVNWKNEADTSAAIVQDATLYDGKTFDQVMEALLSMAQGKIVEDPTDTFDFYNQAGDTVLFTLVKTATERNRL